MLWEEEALWVEGALWREPWADEEEEEAAVYSYAEAI